MKGKTKPGVLRKQAEEEKKKRIREAEAARKRDQDIAAQKAKDEAERIRKDNEKKELDRLKKAIAAEDPSKEAPNQSRVKAAGLKSTFTVDGTDLVITSFGRGNTPVLEKRVTGTQVSDLSEKPALQIFPREHEFGVSGRLVSDAAATNPLWIGGNAGDALRVPGEDLIHNRAKLEQMYFCRNFDDNVHIQMIYSILDIDKILAIHVNNIVYQINNMRRLEDTDHDDLLGYLSVQHSFDTFMNPEQRYSGKELEKPLTLKKWFEDLMDTRQLSYFGTVLRDEEAIKKLMKIKNADIRKQEENKLKERSYYLLCILGTLRQATAHGDESNRASIYTMDTEMKKNPAYAGAKKALDQLFDTRVEDLNKGFLDKAKKNLRIVFRMLDVYDVSEKRRLTRDYYDFEIRKKFKNLGFSVKLLRERLLAVYAQHFAEKQYDSVRSKLNKMLDFVIYEHYKAKPEQADALVERLRASVTEAEKEAVYRVESGKLWNAVSDQVDRLTPMMDGDEINSMQADPDVTDAMIADIAIGTDVTYFSKMMYLLTCFLDGKEINDLLTTLINKFENITGFRKVMDELGLEQTLAPNYRIFADSEKISEELRVINSFARMTDANEKARGVMYMEAAEVLGFHESEEEMEQFIAKILEKPKDKFSPNSRHDFRNFIANNVITSDRFKYLVRYGNPKRIRALASNRNVIDFVLKEIPDAQILRYFNATTGYEETECQPQMRDVLAEKILRISFREFENVKTKNATPEQNKEREKMKAVVRLYLAVLYLLTKNLVYVNSRYYLAFHCVERDAMICDSVKYTPKLLKADYRLYAQDFLSAHPPKSARVRKYIADDMEHSDPWAIRSYRNCVEHMNAVRNANAYIGEIGSFTSYYELYHYLVQRSLMDQYAFENKAYKEPVVLSGETRQYFDNVEKYRGYCMDFVKALNTPFVYNLPRFKNLSIGALFDRNDDPNKKGTGEAAKSSAPKKTNA